jgi:hypothetical protein
VGEIERVGNGKMKAKYNDGTTMMYYPESTNYRARDLPTIQVQRRTTVCKLKWKT